MISFFNKKKYLVDLLEGFIDIHNHILPGIDDGAQTVADSINLIKGFSEFGVYDFVATPHIIHNYHDNTPKTIHDALQLLNTQLARKGLRHVTVEAAAEHMIDDNFETILAEKEVMPFCKDHLLIEMSYLQRPINFDESVIAITKNHFFPVLAHPERYNFLHGRMRKYGEFKQQGILFQLNMLSLGAFYSKDVQRVSLKLLDEGLIDFIGSDVHNINQLNALKNISLNKKTLKLITPIIEQTIARFK